MFYDHKWQRKVANLYIIEAGTCKCLTYLLEEWMKWLIVYRKSWQLIFFQLANQLIVYFLQLYYNIEPVTQKIWTPDFHSTPLKVGLTDLESRLSKNRTWRTWEATRVKETMFVWSFLGNIFAHLIPHVHTFVKKFLEALSTLAEHCPDLLLLERASPNLKGFCQRDVHLPCASKDKTTTGLHLKINTEK